MGKATSLGNALFGKTQRQVLGLLFANPDRSFYASEIMRLADSGIGAVHRELAALESSGLIVASRVGNQKHYRANRASPIFDELRGIVLKTFGVADVLRQALAPLGSKIETAFIYGSIAKGSDTAGSDVDLMVIGEELAYSTLIELAEKAERRLGRKVNPTIYTPSEMQRRRKEGSAFISRVIAQPKIFVIGSEDGLRSAQEPRRRRQAQG